MVKLVNCADEENIGVLWDIHHPYRYFDETPEYTVDTIGDLIRHVHIKDSVYDNNKLKYTMVGYGDLPVRECIERLNAIGYDGFIPSNGSSGGTFPLKSRGSPLRDMRAT